MIVAISGSRSIRQLPQQAIDKLDKIIELKATIYVGDAYGIDAAVQAYLQAKGYREVTVWYGRYLRNNIGGWPTVGCVGGYTERDREMHAHSDFALAIWDGVSKGTRRNIQQMGKKIRVVRVSV